MDIHFACLCPSDEGFPRAPPPKKAKTSSAKSVSSAAKEPAGKEPEAPDNALTKLMKRSREVEKSPTLDARSSSAPIVTSAEEHGSYSPPLVQVAPASGIRLVRDLSSTLKIFLLWFLCLWFFFLLTARSCYRPPSCRLRDSACEYRS